MFSVLFVLNAGHVDRDEIDHKTIDIPLDFAYFP